MNFAQWKKLTKQRQKEIVKNWDVWKDEGRKIAGSVLRAFIKRYGSIKNIEIEDEIVRGNSQWVISVQYLNEDGFKITPANYMGIHVSRFHIGRIDDGVSFKEIPPEVWQRSVVSRLANQAKK